MDLVSENNALKQRVLELEEHLKKYTSPARNRKYYETHKDEILQKMKLKEPCDKDKRKEINKRAYLKRKEKIETGNINI